MTSSRAPGALFAAALVATWGCREVVETASVSLDLSACFLDSDGFRGGGVNAGDQAGRAAQETGDNHFGGDAICRAGLEAYAPNLVMCLAVRVGGDTGSDSVCQFAWDTTTKEMGGGACKSEKALPELSTDGDVVAMRPFFMKAEVAQCPGADVVHVEAGCGEGGVADCLFSLPVVSETLVGTKDFVLGYGYKGGLTPCEVDCVGMSVDVPGGSMPVCWDPDTSPRELCDGVDNDCDGFIDEDFSVLEGGPDAGAGGACAYTIPAGQADEGSAVALGAPCDGVGACGAGLVVCGHASGACGTGEAPGFACCSSDPGCEAADAPGDSAAETCDNADNDCDGETDEDFSVVEGRVGGSVFRGPRPGDPAPSPIALGGRCEGDGACLPGTVVCGHDGAVACCDTNPRCTGPDAAGGAVQEVCDGLDNDCDGLTDEDLTFEGLALGEPCTGVGLCADGLVKCFDGRACCSSNLDCGGRPTGEEVCDGLDNDCDGDTDEEFTVLDGAAGRRAWLDDEGAPVALGAACAGEGVCGALAGHVSCSADQLGTCCTARRTDAPDSAQCVPPGFAGPPDPAPCDDRTDPETCVQLQRVWGDERCDGLDNDCDGATDEGFGAGQECSGSVGVCEGRAGVVECDETDPDRRTVLCSVDPGGTESAALAVELCDGLFDVRTRRYLGQDDDCDGIADADEAGARGVGFLFTYVDADGVDRRLGFPCNLRGQGECGSGIVECDVGDADGDPRTVTRCSSLPGGSESPATEEECNGADDDCDGEIDEDWRDPVLLAAQHADPAGGRTFVEDDAGDPLPLGSPCPGAFGICADSDGNVECAQDRRSTICSVDPGGTLDRSQAEECNGLDDDCDGRIAPGGGPDADDPDERDIDRDGALACAERAALCCVGANSGCDGQDPDRLATVRPGGPQGARNGELCDRIDNDCSGLPGTEFDAVNENDQDGDGATVCDPADLQAGVLDCDDTRGGVKPGASEACNGLDDDCDGDRDEAFTFQGVAIGQACGVGVCRGGEVVCTANGAAAICSTHLGAPLAQSIRQKVGELCNGLDDDCDGVLPANEADPDIDGYLACDGAEPGVLDGDCRADDAASYPGAVEACDNADNNCDGVADPAHFAIQTNPDHCGGCDTPASPADNDRNCDTLFEGQHVLVAGCAAGACTVVRCDPDFYDLDGDPANGCEYACPGGDPFGDDAPDSAATDSDCDGLDGDLDTAVFVDAAAGPCGEACGSMGSPYPDLTAGYAAATALAAAAGSAQVIVAAGTYTLTAPIELAPGASLHGGYCRGCGGLVDTDGVRIWDRLRFSDDQLAAAAYLTTLRLSPPGNYAGLHVTVVAQNLNRPTTVERMIVESTDASNQDAEPARRTSAAVVAENSAQNLRLRDLRLRPGSGGRGPNGASGGAGVAGAAGVAGGAGAESDNPDAGCLQVALPTGGAGAVSPEACVGALSSGGKGGAPGLDVNTPVGCDAVNRNHGACVRQSGFAGLAGRDAPDADILDGGAGGARGAAGVHGTLAGAGGVGGAGEAGSAGEEGARGEGRGGTVRIVGGKAFAGVADGADGEAGQCGGGGGGGGGGAGGVDRHNPQGDNSDWPGCGTSGGSGGGGGAGGSGGAGGRGGGGGGGSVGVVLSDSGVQFEGVVTVVPAGGGRGGNCGAGGAGGAGGGGGAAGASLNLDPDRGVVSGAGGVGGAGGAGGAGGRGGGGGGGPVVGVLRVSGTLNPINPAKLIVDLTAAGAGSGGACAGGAPGAAGVSVACADPVNDITAACAPAQVQR